MKPELNQRLFLKWANVLGVAAWLPAAAKSSPVAAQDPKPSHTASASQAASAPAKDPSPDTILLKDYYPKSIYKIPITQIDKAKFPIIDMHSHPYAKTPQQIEQWIKNMDEVGIQKTMILTMTTGAEFDEIYAKYAKYPERFEVWCGIDFSGYNKP